MIKQIDAVSNAFMALFRLLGIACAFVGVVVLFVAGWSAAWMFFRAGLIIALPAIAVPVALWLDTRIRRHLAAARARADVDE